MNAKLRWALGLGTLLASVSPARADRVGVGAHAEVLGTPHPYAATGSDAYRSGRVPVAAPPERPGPRFAARIAQGQLTPPAVFRDGLIVVGSRSGLHALDPQNGNERWHAAIGQVPFTPVITERATLIALGDGQLWEVDRKGKGRRWARGVKLDAVAPIALGEHVLAAGADGTLYAFTDGELRASLHPGLARVRTLTALRDGRVLVTSDGTEVAKVALDASASERIEVGMRVTASPVVDADGAAWLLGHASEARLLLPNDQVQRVGLAEAPLDDSAPALAPDGELRLVLQSGSLIAIDRTGRERFRRGLDGRASSLLLDATGNVLLTTGRGTLYCVGRDGEATWLIGAGAFGTARPVLGHDGSVLISSRGGRLTAFSSPASPAGTEEPFK